MVQKTSLFFLLICFLFMSSFVMAVETMDVDEITPGMKGYGKTVFSGKRIEVFNVEILGVLKNWEARSDMILIKMSGGPLSNTGIISGMSGSPVYIENRLIGAVSHGWSFAKDAIAGVTPIRAMLNILKIESQIDGSTLVDWHNAWSVPANTQDPDIVDRLLSQKTMFSNKLTSNNNPHLPLTIDLVPIYTPLMVSGFDSRSLRRSSQQFNEFGWFPVQVNREVVGNTADLQDFTPGASVAVELIRGDFSASVIGTLTYRDGDNILAFGHPMVQVGTTDLPMSTAYVYTILACQSGSVKMAVPEKVIGSIRQDRKPAIAGKIGIFTRMIPCQARIRGALDIAYNFEIVHDRLLTPNLFQMAVESALLATEKSIGEKLVDLKLDITIADRNNPITIKNVFFDPGPSWFQIQNVIQPISDLMNNEFKPITIQSIELSANILKTENTASIGSIRINKKWVAPGDEVLLHVRVKPYKQDDVYLPVTIKIPDNVSPGSTICLTVCDAGQSELLDLECAPGQMIPKDFEQLVHSIENVKSNQNVIVRVSLNKRGLTCMGEDFPSLPNSLLNIMALSNQSGVMSLQCDIVKQIETKWLITGNKSINLFVENES
ncbi:MAG: hypothetical protein GY941_18820 [Planctomycetes bacterium]|nr:hypothetical protein [Planctomycetota bacterium]